MLLIAVGTILGACRANVSWGRFWGWDPKEVWALVSLLIYMVVLHGRHVGWSGDLAWPSAGRRLHVNRLGLVRREFLHWAAESRLGEGAGGRSSGCSGPWAAPTGSCSSAPRSATLSRPAPSCRPSSISLHRSAADRSAYRSIAPAEPQMGLGQGVFRARPGDCLGNR